MATSDDLAHDFAALHRKLLKLRTESERARQQARWELREAVKISGWTWQETEEVEHLARATGIAPRAGRTEDYHRLST